MATNTDMTTSTKDSDEVFDNCCLPCLKNGEIKEAVKFCQNCGSYICIQCVKDHSKFPSLQWHRIEDKLVTGFQRRRSSTERCLIHHGRILDRYCKDHDEVCCRTCVTIKHRSCVNLADINESAKDIDAKEHGETNERLDKVISKIILEQDKRSFHLSALDQEKTIILKDIDKFQENIIKRIKELADASREEVRVKHDNLVKAVQDDVKELETVLSVSEESSKKLNSKGQNDVQIFVNVKNSKKVAQNMAETVDELSMNWRKCTLDYCFDFEPFHKVTALKSLGHFEENIAKPYTAKKQGMVNVKLDNEADCIIMGICLLENDIIAVADFQNKKIKRLNESFEITGNMVLVGSPSSVCKTGNQEVAVALRNEGKVQFVTCADTLSLGASFNTSQRCTGLYFDAKHDELYVSCDSWARFSHSKICVYKKSGVLLRTFETDEDGKSIFFYPKHVIMEPITDMVFVADERNGLIALNRSGKREWTFQDTKKLRDLSGVCLLPGNQLLVTGCTSKNIIQVGDDGKEVCELLDVAEGLISPYTVVCDRRNSRIMVGCASNEICIYALRRK